MNYGNFGFRKINLLITENKFLNRCLGLVLLILDFGKFAGTTASWRFFCCLFTVFLNSSFLRKVYLPQGFFPGAKSATFCTGPGNGTWILDPRSWLFRCADKTFKKRALNNTLRVDIFAIFQPPASISSNLGCQNGSPELLRVFSKTVIF